MQQRLIILVIVVMVATYVSGLPSGSYVSGLPSGLAAKICRSNPNLQMCNKIKGTLKRAREEFGSLEDFTNGFTSLDTDGDGFVDGKEIAKVAKYFPGEYADWISSAYKDGDDKLTLDDFLAAVPKGPSYEERE